ncbi:heavy metal-responsive transcriptional regulator [Salinibacterium sp. SYSU T00001]|uniref:heavy metal-responsive transcriptional regulator n=1 Tax=Homoserinimonas sedimenticola TaxID=2986805 RepID=UPI002235C9A5|nr:heavy metal-responsive transcriptional regulator [Salinibacterium sedimenticola]MCW4386538.1 heavy metal-responsive transcriptional regulator [Salinibacterium sedimenticola]
MRIGEAAAAAGMTAKTLRFYEVRGLLPEAKRSANGYRDYSLETTARLDFIRRSRIAGLTLAQIRDILRIRDAGQAPCTHVRDLLAQQLTNLDRQIAELLALRATVAEFHDAAAVPDPAVCNPNLICSYL